MLKRSLIELTRHALFKTGANAILDKIRSARGISSGYLSGSLSERFSRIYDSEIWSKSGKAHAASVNPGSGSGSSLETTKAVRENLPDLLKSLGANRLLDVGCGDFTWMKEIDLGIPYVGVDIVQSVIDTNKAKYANELRVFHKLNACEDELPDADVILCREVLFHLSFADAKRALTNMARKPRSWLITTSDEGTVFNADIRSGDFRILNLRRAPFNFPRPQYMLQDSELVEGRSLGVWRFDEIFKGLS